MSELEFIEIIKQITQPVPNELRLGPGDDCAVIQGNDAFDYIVSTDMLVEHVHFDRSYHDIYALGRKIVAVNLSDIAAMGGSPLFLLISTAFTKDFSSEQKKTLLDGICAIAEEYDTALIGGDTVSGSELSFSVTVIGKVKKGKAIRRDGAKEGDYVYVSGELGGAAAGLACCTDLQKIPFSKNVALCLQQFFNPMPHIEYGLLLAESGCVTAMQDISDGIATDLAHICRMSDTGAVVYEENLPLMSGVPEIARVIQKKPLEFALSGGEDYVLVFTVDRQHHQAFKEINHQNGLPFTKIGEIVPGNKVILKKKKGAADEDISFSGYQHIT